MSYALLGPIIDILIALAICALVFFIARSLIRYAHSLKRDDKSSKQSAEDKRIALQDLYELSWQFLLILRFLPR